MSSCVAELDSTLTSMLELKPPGVSGAKISSLTTLCNSNVQSESVLIQKIYAHFKKAPGNKKLGVLYVVDSVTRQWLEQARKAGQTLGPSASDGTFAAGVNHVTELLPALMADILSVAPEDQKVRSLETILTSTAVTTLVEYKHAWLNGVGGTAKIKKLIEIWERGNTFPANMLNTFKEKLNAPNAGQSTTPTGSPPQNVTALTGNTNNPMGIATAAASAGQPQDTNSILANLQALAKLSNTNAPAPAGVPNQSTNSNNVSYPQAAFPQNVQSAVNPVSSMQPAPQAVNAPTPVSNGVYSYGGGFPQNLFPAGQANTINTQQQPAIPQNGAGGGAPDALQQQLSILQALKVQGIPESQWPALLSVLMASTNPVAAANQAQPTGIGGGRDDSSRDHRNGYDQYNVRSPTGGRYGDRPRSRSRSPRGWDRRRDDSPRRNRRDSPVYGEYSGGNRDRDRDHGGRRGGRGDHDNRGGRRNRGRSPDRFRRSQSPRRDYELPPPPAQKWVEYDPSVPKGKIKVYSRTLFVGGVTTSEDSLRSIFSAFGNVQTCIVNTDKRHAFVKMLSREEAVRAKDGMEHYRHGDMQLRTRWGVGFGPRDCSDYQTGISIIGIDKLTDADRKWMVSAEYGGTGGKPIADGLCVEEPDIEIGAGVSSKAISRRMQTDKSGSAGPRSSREPPTQGRYRQPERRENHERENSNNNVQVPPTVPSFNFQLPMMGSLPFNMPPGVQLPPGFVMPGQNQNQPPPPGAA
ncbi:hypothetical protein MMC10_009998 [Thelotrema lepadinum]|nr:hypothetical protein [Thelotrema lepadinum]